MFCKLFALKILIFILLTLTFSFISTGETKFNLKGKHGEGYLLNILIGQPPQNFTVIIDTGSSNFAIIGCKNSYTKSYFDIQRSKTFINLNKNITSKYTQGQWNGILGSDFVILPNITYNISVRTHVSIIQNSIQFFQNNSEWQGLLGLAYPEISRPDTSVLSWIDALNKEKNLTSLGFSLKLCGMESNSSNHFGTFELLVNSSNKKNVSQFGAAIVREWYYEVLIYNISVGNTHLPISCRNINNDKTIVDSGSTNLGLPKKVFNSLTQYLYLYTVSHNLTLTAEFWNPKETSCFDSPQDWNILPNISLSIAHNSTSYFIVDLPGPSYIKRIYNNLSNEIQYCYKFAVEISNSGTILGAVTMEGFKLVFDRTAKMIYYEKSDCGPTGVGLRGLFTTNSQIMTECMLRRNTSSAARNFFERNILPIFFVSLLIIIIAAVFIIFRKGKPSTWTPHVFITMNRTPQLITED